MKKRELSHFGFWVLWLTIGWMSFAQMNCGAAASEGLQILALGDSYTIGEGVSPEQTWPTLLGAMLQANNPPPMVIARTGWTSRNLINELVGVNLPAQFDLVTLLIGVNNQYQGRDKTEFRAEFVELLNRSIDLAQKRPKRVVVVSIPDYSVTPYCQGRDRAAIARALEEFNEICREEAQKAGVFYVNITPGSRAAENQPKLLVEDGLHPSGLMYQQWAAQIFAVIKGEFRAVVRRVEANGRRP